MDSKDVLAVRVRNDLYSSAVSLRRINFVLTKDVHGLLELRQCFVTYYIF